MYVYNRMFPFMSEIILFKEINFFHSENRPFLKMNCFNDGNKINVFLIAPITLAFAVLWTKYSLFFLFLFFFWHLAKLPGGTLSLSGDLCGLNGRDDKHLLFNSVVNTQPQEKRAVKHSLL